MYALRFGNALGSIKCKGGVTITVETCDNHARAEHNGYS